jgi:hypothetical protein
MATVLAPLPEDLSTLSPGDLRDAIDERQKLLAEVFEQAGDDTDLAAVTAINGNAEAKMRTLKTLSSEVAKLQKHGDTVQRLSRKHSVPSARST